MIKRKEPKAVTRAKQRQLAHRLRQKIRPIENRYVGKLLGLARSTRAKFEASLAPYIKTIGRTDAAHAKALVDHVILMNDTIVRTAIPGVVVPATKDMQEDSKELQLELFLQELPRVIAIDYAELDVLLDGIVAESREAAIMLVERAGRSYAGSVREIFSDPENAGLRVEELADLLRERGDVLESRVELIARDQTLKVNGAITQAQHKAAGVDRYVWSTSRDERVRESHAELEGQTFAWDSPPDVGHPGEDYQCRCVAIPVLPELNSGEED